MIDEIIDLFIELGADDQQLEFPIVYVSAKQGVAKMDMKVESCDLRPIFDTIISYVEPPSGDVEGPFQMLVTAIEYDEYVGRIAIGRIERGRAASGMSVAVCKRDGTLQSVKLSRIYSFMGLKRIEVQDAFLGDIIAVSGIEDINIGETICDIQNPEAIPFVNIDEPTISMTFSVNDSPFAGREGNYVTSRHLRARLFKELETNVQ